MGASLAAPQGSEQAEYNNFPEGERSHRPPKTEGEKVPALREVVLKAVLAGVGPGPEPEIRKHSRAQHPKAGEGVRQGNPAGERATAKGKFLPSDWALPLAIEPVQASKSGKENARLFHQEGQAERQTAGKKRPRFLPLHRIQQKQDSGERREDDKMRGVSVNAQYCGPRREENVSSTSDRPHERTVKIFSQQKHQNRRDARDQDHAEVNAGGSLAE